MSLQIRYSDHVAKHINV